MCGGQHDETLEGLIQRRRQFTDQAGFAFALDVVDQELDHHGLTDGQRQFDSIAALLPTRPVTQGGGVALELAELARQTLDAQLADNQTLRADLVLQRDRFQALDDHQALEIKELRALLDERAGDLRRDREQNETYLRNVEDRAHQEIDRARLDARQSQHRFETLEIARQSALVTVQTERDLLRDRLRKAGNEVAHSRGIASALEKALAKGRTVTPERSKAKEAAVAVGAAKRSRETAARAARKP